MWPSCLSSPNPFALRNIANSFDSSPISITGSTIVNRISLKVSVCVISKEVRSFDYGGVGRVNPSCPGVDMSDLLRTRSKSPGVTLSAGFRNETAKNKMCIVIHLRLPKKSKRTVLTRRTDMLDSQTVTGFLVVESSQFVRKSTYQSMPRTSFICDASVLASVCFPRISKEHTHIIEAKERRNNTLDYSRSPDMCYSNRHRFQKLWLIET